MKEGVSIILYKGDKIIFQHRTDDAPVEPSKWCLFGGRVKEGESLKQTIVREIKEELDYDLKDPKFVYVSKIFKWDTSVFMELYSGACLTLNEGQGMGWYTIKEAKKLDLTEECLDILKFIEDDFNKNLFK